MPYDPKSYWEKRLSGSFKLSGVGHKSFSDAYNKWLYKSKIRTLTKALSEHLIDIHDKSICDVGCGTGFFVDFYKRHGAKHILGIDITETSIENLSRKYPEYSFINADISTDSFLSKINHTFNILNVFDVMYHITDDSAFERAIKNISRLSKSDGFIFITDFCGTANTNIADHVRSRSQKAYETAFGDNHVEIIGIYPLYYLLNQFVFGKTKIAKLRTAAINLDNRLAPIYYFLDGLLLSGKRSNLKLILARKIKKSE